MFNNSGINRYNSSATTSNYIVRRTAIIIKVALYALGLIAAYFGVSTMTSCSTSHNVVASGRTTIVTVDTTIVKHNGFVRSKNYSPYE